MPPKTPNSVISRTMTKREFLEAYVLARASRAADLDGEGAAKQALKAWQFIYHTCL